jgi:tetratricopeptide (TPR) repeat protein
MNRKSGGVVNATKKLATAASLLCVFCLATACASSMTVKQGGEEFGVKTDKYYEALKNQDNGEYFKAIQAWTVVVEDEPRFAEGQFNLGLVYDMLNMVPEATRHYELAVQAQETSDDLLKESGAQEYQTKADRDASLALFNAHLGAAYLRSGLIDEAITALEEALRYDPYNASVHYNLAAAYMGKSNYETALLHADTAVDLVAHPDAKRDSGLSQDVDVDQLAAYLLRQARCHLARNEWDKAKECMDRVTNQCHVKIPVQMQDDLDKGMKGTKPEKVGDDKEGSGS